VATSEAQLSQSPGVRIGEDIENLDTPTILVDLDRLDRNLREWQAWMDERGVKFRVHIKTHKVPEIGLMQMRLGARGICVAKVSEAEPFVDAGIEDVAIAYPVVGEEKWRRVAALAARGVRMTVNCDNELAVRQASEAATAAGTTINLQIDADAGMHRGGIPIDDVDAVEGLARFIESQGGVEFDGLTTHRSYFFEGKGSLRDEGHVEGELLVRLAKALRDRGLEVREVTAGGSFTGKYVAEVPGVTESRAGTYVFYDLMHVNEGSTDRDHLALTALCRVVSLWNGGANATIDGGTKTFSGDRGVVGSDNAQGLPPAMSESTDGRMFIDRLTEEHGMGRVEGTVGLDEKLRFYPFHACTCSNLTNEMVAFRDGKVEAVWKVAARGLRQ
jgi:D-serine deaminase-like pyridoxal phosphate-dependent protein